MERSRQDERNQELIDALIREVREAIEKMEATGEEQELSITIFGKKLWVKL